MKTLDRQTVIPEVVSGTLTTVDHQKISFQHFKNGFSVVIIIAHGYYNSKQCVVLQQLAHALGGGYDIFMFDLRGRCCVVFPRCNDAIQSRCARLWAVAVLDYSGDNRHGGVFCVYRQRRFACAVQTDSRRPGNDARQNRTCAFPD